MPGDRQKFVSVFGGELPGIFEDVPTKSRFAGGTPLDALSPLEIGSDPAVHFVAAARALERPSK